jgi:uncharacterized protein
MTGRQQASGKYLPDLHGLNAEFYRQACSGTLHLQRCAACRNFRHPPRYYCAACGSPEYDWVPSAGRGRLFSWTVTHRATDHGWATEVPFATAVVELEEGVRLVGALEGVGPSALSLDLEVVAHLERRGDDFTYVSFGPAAPP